MIATSKNFTTEFFFTPKSKQIKEILTKEPQTLLHPIHLALEIRTLLDTGTVNTYKEVGEKFGISKARVCQLLKLLELPSEVQKFLLELRDPTQINKFGEHKFRNNTNQVIYDMDKELKVLT